MYDRKLYLLLTISPPTHSLSFPNDRQYRTFLLDMQASCLRALFHDVPHQCTVESYLFHPVNLFTYGAV